jgi:HAD superfamily hydrolase (TIGR01509 family)
MRALIFDYDGLIVDTETPEFECWRRIYLEHGQELKIEDWAHVVGGPDNGGVDKELERRLGRALDWPPLRERRVAHHQELILAQGLLPGIEALMAGGRAAGWQVGVASSSSSAWVEGGLKRFGLAKYVQALRTRDTVGRLKPHPEPYLKVLEDLGAKSQGSFAFEDSFTGVTAAKAAGLRVVAVPNQITRLHDLSAADMILESLEHFHLQGD